MSMEYRLSNGHVHVAELGGSVSLRITGESEKRIITTTRIFDNRKEILMGKLFSPTFCGNRKNPSGLKGFRKIILISNVFRKPAQNQPDNAIVLSFYQHRPNVKVEESLFRPPLHRLSNECPSVVKLRGSVIQWFTCCQTGVLTLSNSADR